MTGTAAPRSASSLIGYIAPGRESRLAWLRPRAPGQGQDQTPLKQVTLDTMVDRTVAALTELPRSVVLVGHSLAGMVISAAAEKAPDRIKTLVFLTALFRITNLIELHSVPASRGRYEELKYPRDHA